MVRHRLSRNARTVRKSSRGRSRAKHVLAVENGTLSLYSAYLIVLIRLVVILFHSDFPHLG